MRRDKNLKEYYLGIVPDGYEENPYYEDRVALDKLIASYLHFSTDVENTLTLVKTGTVADVNLEYCFDIENPEWITLDTSTDVSIDLSAGSTVFFRGNNETFNESWTGNVAQETNYYHFNSTNPIKCAGNIMSILGTESVPNYAFHSLFKGFSNLKSAPDLPATDTGTYCYLRMFHTSGITKAPKINSSIIMDYGCYQIFFQSSITSTPGLVCTEIKQYGLKDGFAQCLQLKNAPNMDSVEIIGNYGCSYMCQQYDHPSKLTIATSFNNLQSVGNYGMECFYGGCEKLKKATAPLKAETVGRNGWDEVFNGCDSLIEGPEYIQAETVGIQACLQICGYTKIKKAPVIKIPTLSSECFKWAWIYNPQIEYVRIESDTNGSNATREWFAGTIHQGGVIEHKESFSISKNSTWGIPSGWDEKIIE